MTDAILKEQMIQRGRRVMRERHEKEIERLKTSAKRMRNHTEVRIDTLRRKHKAMLAARVERIQQAEADSLT